MNAELEQKTERITKMLETENFETVLLNGQHNFAWITGGGCNGIDLSRENGASSILVTREGKRYLIANNIEMTRLFAEEVSANDFEAVEISWQNEKAIGDLVLRTAKNQVEGEIATDIPLFAGTPAIEGKIAPCRYQMTSDELTRYRELGRDAGLAIRRVIDTLLPGETELAVAQKMRNELASKNMMSVVTLVAADERIASFRHPIPTVKTWSKTLLMVTCAKRFGMIVSLSRLVCVGRVPAALKEKTEATAHVYASILDATRPGASGADIYAVAAKAYADVGYGNEISLHHQGGPTGYKTREWVAHPQSSEIVRTDQAFAWNPSITGTKVEETVVTNENGVDLMTASPDFPQIVTNLNGRDYFSPGILSI